jgi:uncharacterized protein (TIGR03437 family)
LRSARTLLRAAALLLVLCATGSAQYVLTEYPGATSPWGGIATGPDGNLWFTDYGIPPGIYPIHPSYPSWIGCITPAGVVIEYAASATVVSNPSGIAAGPDGNLWYTEMAGNAIGRITPGSSTTGCSATDPPTEYSTGLSANSQPYQIVAGPDGNLWFTEQTGNRIGSITIAGAITEYATLTPKSTPYGIAVGMDGNLWFTEWVGGRIGRITTAGVITEYSAGLSAGTIGLTGIAAGPDGNLWFAEGTGNRIGSITTDGIITEYSAGLSAGSFPNGIVAGADGALWFTEQTGARIGRITTDGAITEYSSGLTKNSSPVGIALGPDSAIWFTEGRGGRIGRIARVGPWIDTGGVLSAASNMAGPLAPGEIVSIFGSLLGPATPEFLSLDATGKIKTSLGGVTVSFGGHLAPLAYVGPNQINAIVPYEVAGSASAAVAVTYDGKTSNKPVVQLVITAPGIFTLNPGGKGPGAILNQDNSLNTEQTPAAAGSVVQMFLTGEGLTNPAQATGTITPVNTTGSGPITPAPKYGVTVWIGGQFAQVWFAGEAPDAAAGLLQVNAEIPAGASSGANSITVQVGTAISQNGVTVWVQ